MHRDVCATNKEGIVYWIDELIVELERIKGIINKEDSSQELHDLFETAFAEREKWLDGVTTPWARAAYERPRTPSFANTTAELMFGTRAAKGLFGDDKEGGKDGKKGRR